jgi:hypothetical protein
MGAQQLATDKPSTAGNSVVVNSHVIPSIQEILTSDPDEFVAKYTDIAAINLACAQGLPGAEAFDGPRMLAALDAMAVWVKQKTARSWHLFDQNPAQFDGSKNIFRVMFMLHHLQQQFRVHYNPALIARDSEFDPLSIRDNFIYGILSEERMGTCATLPVFAIALGRRIGYPLKLVNVPDHLLFRWEDGQERFNVDYNGEGGAIHPDEYYYTWPTPWDQNTYSLNQELAHWLTSQTARQEVAIFLGFRCLALEKLGRFEEYIACMDAAARFDPDRARIYGAFRYLAQNRLTGPTIICSSWTGL